MLTNQMIHITEFESKYQQAVEDLVLPIQQGEFGVPITREEQPDLVDIKGVFLAGKGNFWIALNGNSVVGSIGLVDIGNGEAALKKMFVHKEFRGKPYNIAASLLQEAKRWCRSHQSIAFILVPPHRWWAHNDFT